MLERADYEWIGIGQGNRSIDADPFVVRALEHAGIPYLRWITGAR